MTIAENTPVIEDAWQILGFLQSIYMMKMNRNTIALTVLPRIGDIVINERALIIIVDMKFFVLDDSPSGSVSKAGRSIVKG